MIYKIFMSIFCLITFVLSLVSYGALFFDGAHLSLFVICLFYFIFSDLLHQPNQEVTEDPYSDHIISILTH